MRRVKTDEDSLDTDKQKKCKLSRDQRWSETSSISPIQIPYAKALASSFVSLIRSLSSRISRGPYGSFYENRINKIITFMAGTWSHIYARQLVQDTALNETHQYMAVRLYCILVKKTLFELFYLAFVCLLSELHNLKGWRCCWVWQLSSVNAANDRFMALATCLGEKIEGRTRCQELSMGTTGTRNVAWQDAWHKTLTRSHKSVQR